MLECFRSNVINIGIIDDLRLTCVAPKNSPALDAYLDREIAFIDICKKSDKDDPFGADLVITLEIESNED